MGFYVMRYVASSLLAGLFAIAITVTIAGCGSGGRAAVHGKVTLDGQPVENGVIAFLPTGEGQGSSAGGGISNGEYKIDSNLGPMAGPMRVEIRWSKKTGRKIPAGSPLPAGTMIEEEKEAIPPKFNVESTLTREIKSGDNEIDFELTTK